MSDELKTQINEQIKQLEKKQLHLAKVVEFSKEIDALIDQYQSPNFDLEARFSKNIQAFEQFFPDIAKAFRDYQANQLNLSLQNNVLNVHDSQENYLYSEEDAVFSSYKHFHHYRFIAEKTTYALNALVPIPPNQFLHADHTNLLVNYILNEFQQRNIDYQFNTLPEFVNAFVSIGCGLGVHLAELIQHHKVQILYLIEPEMDLFFFSLFITDWDKILHTIDKQGGRIYISIGYADLPDTFEQFKNTMGKYGQYHAANCYLYRAYHTDLIQKIYHYFDKQLHETLFGIGFFDDANISLGHQQANLQNKIPLLKNKSYAFKFQSTPVFIIANGPSLDTTIEQIKQYQGHALIVSCGTAITSLYRYQIVPDIHVEMERMNVTTTILKTIKDESYLKQISLLMLNTVHPSVPGLFKQSLMALKANEASTTVFTLAKNIDKQFAELLHCNPSCLNLALAIFLQLGFRNFYLFGTDLGFPSDKHHSEKSIYFSKEGKDEKRFQQVRLDQSLIELEGNFSGTVRTEPIFNISRLQLEEAIKQYIDTNIKNTSHGVKIKGTFAFPIDDLVLEQPLDKKELLDFLFTKTGSTFEPSTLTKVQDFLSQKEFKEVVDHLIQQFSTEFTSRQHAIQVMDEAIDYLSQLLGTRYHHFYDLLYGSCVNFFTRLIQLLLTPRTPEQGLHYFAGGLQFFINFLHAVTKRYQENPFRVDDFAWIAWQLDD